MLASVAVALLVVAAGCSAPAHTDQEVGDVEASNGTAAAEGPESNGTDSTAAVRVEGGTLDTDPTPIYRRVVRLTEAEAGDQVTVVIEDGRSDDASGVDRVTLVDLLALVPETLNASGPIARTDPEDGTVHIWPARISSRTRLNTTLAHEFVHVQQARAGVIEQVWTDESVTGNERVVLRAVIEGTAVYVESAYVERYGGRQRFYANDTAFEEMDPYKILSAFPYYFGNRYVEHRIDDPAEVDRIYDDPPRSAEAILHPNRNATPRRLSVAVADDESDWNDQFSPTTYGEHFLWATLLTELDNETAWQAATGWGNDSAVRFKTLSGEVGYAWALRMDSERDADELNAAVESYLANRSDRIEGEVYYDDDTALRFVRTSPETGVLLLGNASFVETTAVNGTNDSVTVTPEESTAENVSRVVRSPTNYS